MLRDLQVAVGWLEVSEVHPGNDKPGQSKARQSRSAQAWAVEDKAGARPGKPGTLKATRAMAEGRGKTRQIKAKRQGQQGKTKQRKDAILDWIGQVNPRFERSFSHTHPLTAHSTHRTVAFTCASTD